MSCYFIQSNGQVSLVLGFYRKAMIIRLNSDLIVPYMRINPSILQNKVLGMINKPLKSRIYSFVKLIWGIFISAQMRT